MAKAWIVVASQAGAKIFESNSDSMDIRFVTSLDNELAHLKNSEISRHKPGTVHEGGRMGAREHVMTAGKTPHRKELVAFAEKVAALLDKARTRGEFTELKLVAEPRMLGLLRSTLNENTKRLITESLEKDVEKLSEREIVNSIKEANRRQEAIHL